MNNQFATQFLLEDQSELEDMVSSVIKSTGADEDLVRIMTNAVVDGILTLEKAIEIIQNSHIDEMTGSGAIGGGSTTGGGTTNGASWDPQGPTGTGEQMATRKAFKKKKYQEDAPRLAGNPSKTTGQGAKNLSAYSSVGFTKAPSAEEAGKKLKSIDVKQLWEEGEVEVRWKDIEEPTKKLGYKLHGFKPDSNEEKYFLEYMEEAFNEGLITSSQSLLTTASNYSDAVREDLNESRAYSQFKKETAVRTKDQQMHEAVKMIHKKLEEVSRLAEFAHQMRNELSEGETNLEYKHNTKKVFEKINKKVVEVYSKTKELG